MYGLPKILLIVNKVETVLRDLNTTLVSQILYAIVHNTSDMTKSDLSGPHR
jgi:hypothetical protein